MHHLKRRHMRYVADNSRLVFADICIDGLIIGGEGYIFVEKQHVFWGGEGKHLRDLHVNLCANCYYSCASEFKSYAIM